MPAPSDSISESPRLKRWAEMEFSDSVSSMRAVALAGPAGCGKSTLARQLLPKAVYCPMASRSAQRAARIDPGSLIPTQAGSQFLIDDADEAPAVCRTVARLSDATPLPGGFVLTTATDPAAIPEFGPVLGARLRVVRLRPMTAAESLGVMPFFLSRMFAADFGLAVPEQEAGLERFLAHAVRGGLPLATQAATPKLRAAALQSVIENAVRHCAGLQKTRSVRSIQAVFEAIAQSSGSVFNASELSDLSKCDPRTVCAYSDALHSLYFADSVPACTLVKAAKSPLLIISDSGIMAYLCGIKSTTDRLLRRLPEHSPEITRGLLVTWVYGQIASEADLVDGISITHVRTRTGRVIDFVLERDDGHVLAIKVKAAVRADKDDFRDLVWLQQSLPEKNVTGIVLYAGHDVQVESPTLAAIPMSKFWLY
ncbi:MAG: ATP-binding protein [Duodenibacillus sp.]|nr:ATP-binding protein [Duodenibacillus sp.]